MRVNEDFALLVKLIHQCFIDVKIFLFFTVAWIIFFTLEALILGIQISESGFSGINFELRAFIFFW